MEPRGYVERHLNGIGVVVLCSASLGHSVVADVLGAGLHDDDREFAEAFLSCGLVR